MVTPLLSNAAAYVPYVLRNKLTRQLAETYYTIRNVDTAIPSIGFFIY